MFVVSEDDSARARVQRLAAGAVSAFAGGGPRLVERLRGPEQALEAARRRLATGGPGADRPAAEWLLDNYYIVERTCRFVREEFPPAF